MIAPMPGLSISACPSWRSNAAGPKTYDESGVDGGRRGASGCKGCDADSREVDDCSADVGAGPGCRLLAIAGDARKLAPGKSSPA